MTSSTTALLTVGSSQIAKAKGFWYGPSPFLAQAISVCRHEAACFSRPGNDPEQGCGARQQPSA